MDPDKIIEKEQLIQVSNTDELSEFVKTAISDNLKAVNEYKAGKAQAIMFLVGQIMKKSKGKANPKVVKEMLEKQISEI